MIKRTLMLLSVSAAYFMQAQSTGADLSVLKNSADVYSAPQMTGTAKYMGMAGSMGALGGDISAVNNNPASIGVFITNDLSATLGVNGYTNKSSMGNSSVSYKDSNATLANAGGVIVFESGGAGSASPWKFINIGINYASQNLDNHIETYGDGSATFTQDFLDQNGGTFTDTFTLEKHTYRRIGDFSKFNIAVGANYDNKIYIGGAVNMSQSNFEQGDLTDFFSAHDQGTYLDNDKQFTPYGENAVGLSISAGIIAKVSQQLRLGLALETPTWWSIERGYTEYSFQGNEVYFDKYSEDRRFTSPFKATISGAFVASKNFAVNLDYTLGLTKPKYQENSQSEADLNALFSETYKNVQDLRIGGEYRYLGFRVRAGYGFATSAFDNYLKDFTGKRQTVGFGLGYDFKSFYVDAAYQYVSTDTTNYFGGGSYFTNVASGNFEIVSPAAFTSKLKNTQNNIFITAGWRF